MFHLSKSRREKEKRKCDYRNARIATTSNRDILFAFALNRYMEHRSLNTKTYFMSADLHVGIPRLTLCAAKWQSAACKKGASGLGALKISNFPI